MARPTIAIAPIRHLGRTFTLREWCARLNLEYNTVAARYRRNIREPHELFAPTRNRGARSDVPHVNARSERISALAYNPIFHLLDHRQRQAVLTYCDHDPTTVFEFLRNTLRAGVDETAAIPAHLPADPRPGAMELHAHPLLVGGVLRQG